MLTVPDVAASHPAGLTRCHTVPRKLLFLAGDEIPPLCPHMCFCHIAAFELPACELTEGRVCGHDYIPRTQNGAWHRVGDLSKSTSFSSLCLGLGRQMRWEPGIARSLGTECLLGSFRPVTVFRGP